MNYSTLEYASSQSVYYVFFCIEIRNIHSNSQSLHVLLLQDMTIQWTRWLTPAYGWSRCRLIGWPPRQTVNLKVRISLCSQPYKKLYGSTIFKTIPKHLQVCTIIVDYMDRWLCRLKVLLLPQKYQLNCFFVSYSFIWINLMVFLADLCLWGFN